MAAITPAATMAIEMYATPGLLKEARKSRRITSRMYQCTARITSAFLEMLRRIPLSMRMGPMFGILSAATKAVTSPAIPKKELATNIGRDFPRSLFMMLKFGSGISNAA